MMTPQISFAYDCVDYFRMKVSEWRLIISVCRWEDTRMLNACYVFRLC